MEDPPSNALQMMNTVIDVIRSMKRKRKSNRCIYDDSAFLEDGTKRSQELMERLTTINENEINSKKSMGESENSRRKCAFNLKQYKKQLSFQRFRQQSKEEDSDKVFGEICDIRHSPYRIFKAAESGNLEEFERLYKIDNSRLSYRNAKGRTCVHFAASANRVSILTAIYSYNGDLNILDNEGNTPMHDAVHNNACDSLDFLLEKNANSTILNNDLYAPLHLAALLNKVDCIKIFIKHRSRIDIQVRGKHGRTPLHIAAIFDHAEVARLLLTEMKCCPKLTCDNGYAPIHEAARNASAGVLKVMLEYSKGCGYTTSELLSCFDSEGNVPLHSAVHAGDIRAVEICLEYGSNISSQQHDLSTPLHLACSQGAIEIVKLMLCNSSQDKLSLLTIPDAQQMTPIHCASMFDHADLCDYLCSLEMANSILETEDKDGRTVLLLAGARAAWKCASVLIKRNAKIDHIDSYNRNLLHHIVMNGGDVNFFNKEVKEATKDERTFLNLLNQKDVFGCTELHYAAREGNLKTVQSLLDLGSSISVRNNDNQSALHFAARYGRYNTVKFLLDSRKGNQIINDMDGEGMTCLHIASMYGHTRIVQLLLLKGALLHRDHRGRTPLHYAACNGHGATMQQLLTVHSHLLDQQDREGNTALHLAAMKCKPNAASILLSLNCKIKKNFTECTAIDYALHMKSCEVMHALVLHPTRSTEIMNYPAKKYGSLIEGLIATMPDVMSAILDTGVVTSSDQSEDSKSFFIKYSFDCLRKVGDAPLPVLNLMVKYGREQLICHPLCLKYLESKWNSYGMYYHLTYLAIYMAFLACLTKIVLEVVDSSYHSRMFRFIVREDLEDNETLTENSFNHRAHRNYTHLDWNNEPDPYYGTSMSCKFSCLFVILFTFFSIIKEFHQMKQRRSAYFMDIINLMLWALYLTSTFITFGMLFQTSVNSSVLYIVSAIAIFLAWFNCLLYFQRFNTSGIYVVMFFEILLTLVRVLLVFCVLIIAFSLSFYILLTKFQQKKGFNSVQMSIVRIITMMLGEMDFLSTFLQPILLYEDEQIISKQIVAATWFLIIFAILMPILLMNLLIGLAVGDIETVRCNAQMKRLTMQVQMHTDLEMKLPKQFKMYVDKEEVYDYPNTNKCSKTMWSKFKGIFVNNKGLSALGSTPSKGFSSTGSASTDILSELHKQKNKLRNISKTLDQQLQMIKLIVKKVEVQTENDYNDYSSEISDDEDHIQGNASKLTALSSKK